VIIQHQNEFYRSAGGVVPKLGAYVNAAVQMFEVERWELVLTYALLSARRSG
jgi:hypothetical protein